MNNFPVELKNLASIKEINLQSFIRDINFKRGAMILSGGYARQNFYSIIASKLYDINQKGFCFWAHRYAKTDRMLKLIFDFLNDKGEKYLIMTYTNNQEYVGDNSLSMQDDESIEEYYTRMWGNVKEDSKTFYVKEYKCFDKANYDKYPKEMFPEVVFEGENKNSGTAYLISEFNYLTENIKIEDLCTLFKQTTQGMGESEKCTYCKRPGHRLIELKNDFESLLPSTIKKTNEITYIIAKLKYPYIVSLKA